MKRKQEGNEKVAEVLEYNDVYDADRNLTGKIHIRGTEWGKGEFGLGVCVWVYDGEGKLLMTRRAPEKTFAGTWENSGGAAQAGETSRQAIARELFEETGIRAEEGEFEFLCSDRDRVSFYDHYCIQRRISLDEIVLLPGETDDVKWVNFEEVHRMIDRGEICDVIAHQFLRMEKDLLTRVGVKK